MANKYDLVTVVHNHGTQLSGVHSIGGPIAAGKTRFLTYLRIERGRTIGLSTVTGVTTVVASVAESSPGLAFSDLASSGISLNLPGMSTVPALSGVSGIAFPERFAEVHMPNKPNMEHPIFKATGGASSFMVVALGRSAPLSRIFAAYYDE